MSSTPFSALIEAAKEAKFVVIPKAEYAVVCRDATATKSSTAKDMIKLAVKVVLGPYAGNSVLTQQTLTEDNPAAVAIFLKFLDAFGLDEEFLAALPPRADGGPDIAAVAAALKGRPAMASVGIHEWNSEDRNDVERFRRPKPEEAAAITEALSGGGAGPDPFAAPKAVADPFAAAPAPAAAPASAPSAEPF